MTKGNKISLKIAAVISFVMAVFSVWAGLSVIFNWFGAGDIFNKYLNAIFDSQPSGWRNTYKYMVAVETVISSAINIYVGIIYIKISRVADIVLGMGKILVYLGVMQLLFGGSVVSSIIVFCVSYSVTHKINKIKNRPKEETKMQTLASKVKNIKWLKETGKISAEEYEKKLNELLENNALNELNETKED